MPPKSGVTVKILPAPPYGGAGKTLELTGLAVNWLCECDRKVRVPGELQTGRFSDSSEYPPQAPRWRPFVPAAGGHNFRLFTYKIGPAAPPILLPFAEKSNVKLLLFPALSVVLLLLFNSNNRKCP